MRSAIRSPWETPSRAAETRETSWCCASPMPSDACNGAAAHSRGRTRRHPTHRHAADHSRRPPDRCSDVGTRRDRERARRGRATHPRLASHDAGCAGRFKGRHGVHSRSGVRSTAPTNTHGRRPSMGGDECLPLSQRPELIGFEHPSGIVFDTDHLRSTHWSLADRNDNTAAGPAAGRVRAKHARSRSRHRQHLAPSLHAYARRQSC